MKILKLNTANNLIILCLHVSHKQHNKTDFTSADFSSWPLWPLHTYGFWYLILLVLIAALIHCTSSIETPRVMLVVDYATGPRLLCYGLKFCQCDHIMMHWLFIAWHGEQRLTILAEMFLIPCKTAVFNFKQKPKINQGGEITQYRIWKNFAHNKIMKRRPPSSLKAFFV